MKLRIIILLLIVIVLVSLSWFKVLMAQDLDLLGDEEKRQLLEKYRKQQALGPESYYYQSPEIFGGDQQSDQLRGELFKDIASPLRDSAQVFADTRKQKEAGRIERMPEFEQLRPFGTELFASPQENDPPTDIASAADYVLGPGDNVIIYLWGGWKENTTSR